MAQTIGYSGLNESKLTTFTVTLKGVFSDYTPQKFEEQFRHLLLKLVEDGIQESRVQEFLHQLQVKLATPREINGIRLLEESIALMNHKLSFGPFLNPVPLAEEAGQNFKDKTHL